MSKTVEISNKRANYEYHFLEVLEAGIVLQSSEIKSIRKGQVNMGDAFCAFKKDELWLRSMHISEYKYAHQFNHDPMRPRKLLLKRQELKKWLKKVKERGFTIVPVRLYMNERGFVKIEIALAQGKKSFDKRNTIKERDNKRDLARIKKIRL